MISRYSFLVLTPLLSFIASLLFVLSSRDVHNYRNAYHNINDFSVASFAWIEPGWVFLFYVFKNLNFSFDLFAILTVCLVFFLKSHFIYRHSTGYLYSIIIYSVWFLPLHDATQLRISATIVCLFYSSFLLSQGRNTASVLVILLSLLLHYSALFFLALNLSNYLQKRLVRISFPSYLSILMVASLTISFMGGMTGIIVQFIDSPLFLKLQNYISRGDTNDIFTPKSLFAIVSSLFFVSNFNRLRLNEFEKVCLHTYILGTCSYFFFIDISIISTRVSELLFTQLIFLAPKFVRSFKEVPISQFILILTAFIIGYYYFVHIGLFHEK